MDENNISPSSIASQNRPQPAHPCVLVIFGAAGDLTKRLLYPAICNLGCAGLLDKNFCIIGIAKDSYTEETFRQQLKKNIDEFVTDPDAKTFGLALADKFYYIAGEFSHSNMYLKLQNKLEQLATDQQASKNYLFYFAAPPECIDMIAGELEKTTLLKENDNHFRRILVEKPFGHDLESAIELNRKLLSIVKENQLYRIDHFLGKETVQNLLAFRFSNSLFESVWNHAYIDHMQITVAETLGVEHRGGYYEHVGAMRDMVPNHIFQMLSLITMEPPPSYSADHIHAERIKSLQAVKILTSEQVLQNAVRGQYGPGKIDNKSVPGYRSEPNVSPNSQVETYFALKLHLDNQRWLNVPFYIRTGKRLPVHTSEIIIQFKSDTSTLFSGIEHPVQPNLLKIYIQPNEGISLFFNSKIPGPHLHLDQFAMKFKYSDYFAIKPQTGYEPILYDCMNGDHLLFKKSAMIEAGWAIVQPILNVWSTEPARDFPNYAAGTWGPQASEELLLKDSRKWLL